MNSLQASVVPSKDLTHRSNLQIMSLGKRLLPKATMKQRDQVLMVRMGRN